MGFLFVFDHGAEEVLDLAQGGSLPSAHPMKGYFPVTYPTGLLWNPYPSMLGADADIWPQNFPPHLREIKQEVLNEVMERVPAASIGIVQNLPPPPNPQPQSVFSPSSPVVALGLKTFAPLTEGTTLFTKLALWALFLPKHETSAVLRGFLAQPLLWRLGQYTAFSLSKISQETKEGSDAKGDIIDIQLLQALRQTNLTACATLVNCLTLIYSQHHRESLQQLEAWLFDLNKIGYEAPQLRPYRQFAYLTQGAALSSKSKPRLNSAVINSSFDTFYLSFSNNGSGDLFFPKSTFQQGRNALLRLALSMEVFPGYDYFVFTDEDVQLENVDDPSHFWKTNMSTDPWVRMEVPFNCAFYMLWNLSTGVLTQIHTDGWFWEVRQLGPDNQQLWFIFDHNHT